MPAFANPEQDSHANMMDHVQAAKELAEATNDRTALAFAADQDGVKTTLTGAGDAAKGAEIVHKIDEWADPTGQTRREQTVSAYTRTPTDDGNVVRTTYSKTWEDERSSDAVTVGEVKITDSNGVTVEHLAVDGGNVDKEIAGVALQAAGIHRGDPGDIDIRK